MNTIKTLQDVCNELHIDFRIFSFLCLVLVVAPFPYGRDSIHSFDAK